MKSARQPQRTKQPLPTQAWWLKYFPYVMLVVVLLVYGNSISNQYSLDDDFVTRKNSLVQKGFGGVGDIFTHGFFYGFNGRNDQAYRPFTVTTFAIEHEFFGNNPQVSHFVNVLLFGLLVVVLYLLLSRLFKSYHAYLPVIITLLFAVHPIHTEVVASIKSRDELLSLLLGLVALYLLIRYVDTKQMKFLITSVVSYIISVLSKESSFTLVAAIPLLLYFFTGEKWKRIAVLSSAYVGVVLVYMLIRTRVLDAVTFDEELTLINNSLVGAHGFSEKWGTKFILLFHYFRLMLVPYPLSSDYSFNQIPVAGLSSLPALAGMLIYLAMLVYAVYGMKKKDPAAFGVLFYLITLSVSSNFFIPIGSIFAERFLFTPSVGFMIAFVFLMYAAEKKWQKKNTPGPQWVVYFFIPVSVLFAWLSFNRNKDWYNNVTLFTADVKSSPNSARMHFFMGTAYRDLANAEKNAQQRMIYLQKAVEEFNRSTEIYPGYSEAYYNTGVSYYEMGDRENAILAYRMTRRAEPEYPNANNNLGVIFFEQNMLDSAVYYFKEELRIDSLSGNAYGNIGAAYHNQGDLQNAVPYYEKAIELTPSNVNNYNNLIKALEGLGDTAKANVYRAKLNALGTMITP